jgi:hypothetical protein
MLTKNAQILFDPNEYAKLAALASKSNSSVGKLVRTAVRLTYFVRPKKEEEEKSWIPEGVFGAWKDHPLSDDELDNILSGPGLELDYD